MFFAPFICADQRNFFFACFCRIRASVIEAACSRNILPGGLQLIIVFSVKYFRLYIRNSGEQKFCVGMLWIQINIICRSNLHNIPPIHHCNPVAKIVDYIQIVGNKQQRKFDFLMQFPKQVPTDTSSADTASSATISFGESMSAAPIHTL